MTRMALATMVWSSAARNIPSIRPMRMVMISRCESAGAPARASACDGSAVVSDMSVLFLLLVLGGGIGHGRRRCPPGPEVGVERVAELAQAGDELRGGGPVPVAEQPLEPGGAAVLDAAEDLVAGVGERHDPGAAVVGVGALLQQAARDQRADLAAHRGDVVV